SLFMSIQTSNIFFTFRTTCKLILNIDDPDVYVGNAPFGSRKNSKDSIYRAI
ncbi:hypothetical protein CY34DRAFT_665168, partial [Suillus luteus UH-Slu-Lm8-n1]